MDNLNLLQKKKRKKKTSVELSLEEANEKVKPIEKKKRKREKKGVDVEAGKGIQVTTEVMREEKENENIKPIGKMKKKGGKGNNVSTGKVVQVVKEENVTAEGKRVKIKAFKKKRKNDEKNSSLVGKSDEQHEHDDGSEDESPSENQGFDDIFIKKTEAIDGTKARARKSKKSKKRKKDHGISQECKNVFEKNDDAYSISSGEEDCSKGMTKWIAKYHRSRPGLKVLQQRIDDFMSALEQKREQERKEREAEAEKDGWTVVVHHKGRKKTTDSESGITVGSVAPAVAHKLSTAKKHKEVNLEFYRFQKRESQRTEILALQSKFEQDKKRIKQLRAARKFKPY